jgi:hypothetical protein
MGTGVQEYVHMRKLTKLLAGASGLLVAAPAIAQYGAQADFQARIGNLQNRIEAGVRSGAITGTEAAPLREQLRNLQRLERRYAAGGFTQVERTQLQPRIQSLRQQIATAERNDYARPRPRQDDAWDNDDRDARYGGDDRYKDDGYRERDWDRDREEYNRDRYDDASLDDVRAYDRDYDPAEDRYGARIGSRVPGHYGGVPYELRDDFPETMPFTYRFWEGRVFQVERRTGVIVRIYDVDR